MKLLNKLLPLSALVVTASSISPMLTACTTNGWIDGTKKLDTTSFTKYLGDFDWKETSAENQKLVTDSYLIAIKSNPQIINDDFAYSLSLMNAICNLLPEYAQSEWNHIEISQEQGGGEEEEKDIPVYITDFIPSSPLTSVTVNEMSGRISDFELQQDKKQNTYASYKIELSFDVSANINVVFKDGVDVITRKYILDYLGFDLDFALNFKLNTCFQITNCPMVCDIAAVDATYHELFNTIMEGYQMQKRNSIKGIGFGLDFQKMLESLINNEISSDDWSISGLVDLQASLKSPDIDANFIAIPKKEISITADDLSDLIIPTFNSKDVLFTNSFTSLLVPEELPSIKKLARMSQLFFGWSTYYFSDVAFPQKDIIIPEENI